MTLATFLGYTDAYSWLHDWLPIIFMGLLVLAGLLLVRAVSSLMRLMPRTNPKQIKPDSAPQIGWAEIAGADEAKEELQEVVEYLRDPKRFRQIGARVPKGILLHGPHGNGKKMIGHKRAAQASGAVLFSSAAFVL